MEIELIFALKAIFTYPLPKVLFRSGGVPTVPKAYLSAM
jgi:hypothetical protein